MSEAIQTRHGPLPRPTFLPDATRGAVRATDLAAVRAVGVQGLMVNAFHLAIRPGADRVRRLGGLHRFMGWDGPIVSDSGGFQALSLIRAQPGSGTIRRDGIVYKLAPGERRIRLTPEKSVRVGFQLGADVVIALDDCPAPDASAQELRRAVERTIDWARRGRDELARQLEGRREAVAPLLVGVVQGGPDEKLRRECAEALVDLGYRAFGFGGWPLDAEGALALESFQLLARLLPPEAPRFALGVGKPEHVVAVARLGGREVFDCTIPTRDARHHRLYTFVQEPAPRALPADASFYRCLHILDQRHANEDAPLEEGCDCPCCRRYSRAYLHHLFKIKDAQAEGLATLHNLRFYTRLLEALALE